MAVPTTPPGYHTVTPYLIAKDANAAIAFYKAAFGAVESQRNPSTWATTLVAAVSSATGTRSFCAHGSLANIDGLPTW